MNRLFMVTLIISAVFISCTNYMNVKLKFDEIGSLAPRANVMIEDTVIGKVTSIESEGGNYIVKLSIDDDYANRMNVHTKFFLLDKNSDAKIVVITDNGGDAKIIESTDIVQGYGELMYYALKSLEEISKSAEKIFRSEEWLNFQKKLQKDVDEVIEKGKNEYNTKKPELEKRINDFLDKMEEKYGEEAKGILKPFIDSIMENK